MAASKNNFKAEGTNKNALFTLMIHRGEGMCLLAMNWKNGKPTKDFVGFGIEYKEPAGTQFYPLTNRLGFPHADGSVDPNKLSTLNSPIQKFRWVHFPFHPELPGLFTYRVTPLFMDKAGKLSAGEHQLARIALMGDTYPNELNVCFTRGFVASQAFVDRFDKNGPINTLIPAKAAQGLTFKATHPDAKTAYAWMGFESRAAILAVLDKAIADKKAEVRVVAYDLNIPEIVDRLVKIGKRLKVIIDISASHNKKGCPENTAAARLMVSAGKDNVKRQKMGSLQHNKTIVVNSAANKWAVCGSTNFSWRAFYVQSNNAIVLKGAKAIQPFLDAFDNYWAVPKNKVADFGNTKSAKWNDLGLASVKAKVAFSPHVATNALYKSIADDIDSKGVDSILYSLAFLYESPGALRDVITKKTKDKSIFIYGISDKKVKGGINVQKADGNVAPVYPSALVKKNTPEPFKSEPTGGSGARMHHKFIVLDFNKPTARVYMGSYNFSSPADIDNGENLLLINDQKVATSYMIQALSIFDHYEFRLAQLNAKKKRKTLTLKRPPEKAGEKAWWEEDYTVARKIHDRELFSS